MFEQFGNYSEIKWVAAAAAQAIGPGTKIQVAPDLVNFRLERFKDLRAQPKVNEGYRFKLMLIGSSKTNVFVDGPDTLLDELVKRLPNYKGKSWLEIKNINLEKNFSDCKNAFTSVCNQQEDELEHKPVELGKEAYEPNFAKADEICAKCEHFESNKIDK